MSRSRRKLLWRLYPSYLLILVLSLVTVGLYASGAMRRSIEQETARDLKVRAELMAAHLTRAGELAKQPSLQARCRTLGQRTATRFTVVLPNGEVLADSDKAPGRMDNHGDRPEIKQALRSASGRSVRYSTTLGQDMMYVAVPLRRDGRTVAVVRASKPLQTISAILNHIYWRLALGGLLVALLAGALALLIAHRINRPLREMQAGAARFAAGDLRYRLAVPSTEETGDLAIAMNDMAAQLDDRIRTVTQQKNELEAVLSSMVEAVLVVDADGRLLRFNHAARSLLDLDAKKAEGRPMEEVIRNAELHRLLAEILDSHAPREAELVLHRDEDRHLSAAGASLHGPDDEHVGALVVLHDLTHLRRLESVRQDFVANVSHELKTPITAIQGFVETLRDGALNDQDNADRFLDIIARHADRLNAIIEDLLALSRLEQGAPAKLAREPGRIGDVLTAAGQLCEHAAEERGINIVLEGDLDLEISMRSPLLEEAVVNLCDNAIKYSERGAAVTISVTKEERHAVIAVRDTGSGIPEPDQARVFERFYRVDKARSRDQGGTGLGLALVKHIVNLHRGRVDLESQPGQGTVFRVYLPLDK